MPSRTTHHSVRSFPTHQTIIKAENLLAVVSGVGVDLDAEIGVCSHCDLPTDSLSIHPEDYGMDIEDARLVCSDCSDDLNDKQ